jgi:hypothetical protein
MAVEWRPAVGFSIAIPPATLVRVGDPAYGVNVISPPDNCHTIVLYNMAAAAGNLFVRFDTSTFAAPLTPANSTVIPPASTMSFGWGFFGEREGANFFTGPVVMFLYSSLLAGNLDVNVTFLQGKGYSGVV